MAKQPELNISLNPKLFNNIYWHLEEAFDDLNIRYIWCYGGSSASKTYSVVQLIVKKMLSLSKENTLVLRKFHVDIKDSIYSDFKTIIGDWGLTEYFLIQTDFILCKLTGSFVRFRGLDDSEKVKGITGFRRVILEEISQFDEQDLKQIKKRLRGRAGQQIIGIFNPISEEHWIKTNVFDQEVLTEIPTEDMEGKWINENGNTVIMQTNYLYNVFIVGRWKDGKQVGGFIDQHVIEDFEKDKLTDNAYYQVYGLGNWGKIRTGGEFWKDFDVNRHLTNIGYDPELPIFMSWDENVNPYLTCLLWQIPTIDKKKTAIQIDEICLPDPKNRRHHVCNEFMARYPLVKGLYVGGDRTSMKEDTAKEKGENFFTDILKYLHGYRPTLRIQSSNPSVVQSAGFINSCFAGRVDIPILINEKCRKSIYDYQYALEDSDGTLKKSHKTNKLTKVTYEEFGHASDAMRYFMTVAFANDYNIYLRGARNSLPIIGKNVSRNAY